MPTADTGASSFMATSIPLKMLYTPDQKSVFEFADATGATKMLGIIRYCIEPFERSIDTRGAREHEKLEKFVDFLRHHVLDEFRRHTRLHGARDVASPFMTEGEILEVPKSWRNSLNESWKPRHGKKELRGKKEPRRYRSSRWDYRKYSRAGRSV